MPGRDRVDRARGSTGGSRGAASGVRAGKSDPTGKRRPKSLPASSRAARTGLQSGPHGMASRSGQRPRGRGTADPGRNGLPGFSSRSPLTVPLGSVAQSSVPGAATGGPRTYIQQEPGHFSTTAGRPHSPRCLTRWWPRPAEPGGSARSRPPPTRAHRHGMAQ